MDPSNTNMNGGHYQQSNNGTSYGFLNSIQSYATDIPDASNNEEYEFMWNPELFQQPNQTSSFPPQSTTLQPNFNQPSTGIQSSRNPALPQYGGMSSNYNPHQYSQTSFDPRNLSQSSFDPRSIQRPSPSPGPFVQPTYQSPMNYGGGDRSLSAQGFSPYPGMMQPRQHPSQNPNYLAPVNQNGYYTGAHPNQQSQPQGIEMNHFSGFPEPIYQPSNSYVDPSVLTANEITDKTSTRQDPNSQRVTSGNPFVQMSYLSVIPPGDPLEFQNSPYGKPGSAPPNGVQTGVLVPQTSVKSAAKIKVPKDPNAPKRQRSRSRKDDAMAGIRDGDAASATTSGSDEEDQTDDDASSRPEILSMPAPSDPADKAIYDVVSAVWYPHHKPAVPDLVRNGISMFGETIKRLRDAWKVKNEALKQAELANTAAIPTLKEEVAKYRRTVETAVRDAVQYGHDSHISKLGENPFTMSGLQSFLVDRVTVLDFDGSLVASILKLVAKFTTLDEEMLEKTKTMKILSRINKKAIGESKALSQQILDNAAQATKMKATQKDSDIPKSPVSANGNPLEARKTIPVVAIPRKVETVAGVKRPREAEGGLPATKKPVSKPIVPASKPLALQNAERKRAEAVANIGAKLTKPTINGTTAATAKPKVALVAPPKAANSPFSSLMSASKKPGTSNAARAAAAKDKPTTSNVKRETSPPTVTKPQPQASYSSFLDTLTDMNAPKEAEPKKVDIDPSESVEDRLKRLRKEARRKLRVSWRPDNSLEEVRYFTHDPDEEVGHADSMMRDVREIGGEGRMLKLHKDLDDIDDDEEAGEELEEYIAPSAVDFGDLEEDARSGNFVKMGGVAVPDTPSSLAQARHEENTVMVVYAAEDVPTSPKEPPSEDGDEDYAPVISFGDPPEEVRAKEAKYIAVQGHAHPSSAGNPSTNVADMLQGLNQPQQQQSHVSEDLLRTIALFQQQQQQPPPQAQPQPAPGFAQVVASLHQLQAQQQAPQYQPPTVNQTAAAQNLAAMIAQLSKNSQSQAQSLDGQGNPNPYSSANGNASSGYDSDGRNQKKKKPLTANAGSEVAKPYNYKTQVCNFWLQGRCTKGDDCTYRHDEES